MTEGGDDQSSVGAGVFTGGKAQKLVTVAGRDAGIIEGKGFTG